MGAFLSLLLRSRSSTRSSWPHFSTPWASPATSRAEVARHRRPGSFPVADRRPGAAWPLRRPTQRHGTADVQALVDAHRPAGGRTQHLRARRTPALALLFWQWRPLPGAVCGASNSAAGGAALRGLFALGWLAAAGEHVPHQPLRALRAAVRFRAAARRRAGPSRVPGAAFYRVRHPIYLGFILASGRRPMSPGICCSPSPPPATSLSASGLRSGTSFAQFGERYRRYRRQAGMLLPYRRAE